MQNVVPGNTNPIQLEQQVQDLQDSLIFKIESLLLFRAPSADTQSFIKQEEEALQEVY